MDLNIDGRLSNNNNINNINLNFDNLNTSEKDNEREKDNSKMERFAKLSEKINALSKASENNDPKKY